jgi:hypothetical protein
MHCNSASRQEARTFFGVAKPGHSLRKTQRQSIRLSEEIPSPYNRPFPSIAPPWTVEDVGGSFVVKASNDRPLVFI